MGACISIRRAAISFSLMASIRSRRLDSRTRRPMGSRKCEGSLRRFRRALGGPARHSGHMMVSFLAQWKTRHRAVNVCWHGSLMALYSGKSGSNGLSIKSSFDISIGSCVMGHICSLSGCMSEKLTWALRFPVMDRDSRGGRTMIILCQRVIQIVLYIWSPSHT